MIKEAVSFDRAAYNQGANAQYDPQYITDGTVSTLVARGPGGVAMRTSRGTKESSDHCAQLIIKE